MKRTLTIIGLAVAGIVLAVALSVGAFALVGDPLSEPATTIQVPTSPTKSPSEDRATPSPSNADALERPRRPHRRAPHRATITAATAAPAEGEDPEPGDDHGGDGGGHGSDD